MANTLDYFAVLYYNMHMKQPYEAVGIDEFPDVMPSVIFDVGFGGIAKDLDMDFHYLTEYMRGRGLSDEQIQAMTLEFRAPLSLDSDEDRVGLEGQYSYDKRTCIVHLANIAMMKFNTAKLLKLPIRWVRAEMQAETARTVAHEIEHYVSHAEAGFVNPTDYISWQSDSDDTAYREQPEEVRARSAERRYDVTRVRMI